MLIHSTDTAHYLHSTHYFSGGHHKRNRCSHYLHAAVPPFSALSQWAKRRRNDSSGKASIAEESMPICFPSELSKPRCWLQWWLNFSLCFLLLPCSTYSLEQWRIVALKCKILFLWPAFYIFFPLSLSSQNLVIYPFLVKFSHVILWVRTQDKLETGTFCIFLFYCIWSPREKDTTVRTSGLCQIVRALGTGANRLQQTTDTHGRHSKTLGGPQSPFISQFRCRLNPVRHLWSLQNIQWHHSHHSEANQYLF